MKRQKNQKKGKEKRQCVENEEPQLKIEMENYGMSDSDDEFQTDEFSANSLQFPSVEQEKTGEHIEKKEKKKSFGSFSSMGLCSEIFKAIQKKGYKIPTPIQRKTIPLIITGIDVVAMARTGSGKTASFLIPILERLKKHSTQIGARCVILSPTRELAIQTMKFVIQFSKYTDLRSCLLVGGDSMEEQFTELAKNPDIIVATPGRLIHHLNEAEISLKCVECVVYDEADRLFEMGFAEQISELCKKMPDGRQSLLFSATLPQMLVDFARAGLNNPQLVRLDTDTKLSDTLKLQFFTCTVEEKAAGLLFLLKNFTKPEEQTIVFTATRHHVEYLHQLLREMRYSVTMIYGSMDMTARKINLANFRNGKRKILIVTDVAARGIDIPLLDNVINYDFPAKSKLFVHRVGRVARMGRIGTAYSLVSLDEMPYMFDWYFFANKEPLNTVPEGKTFNNSDIYFGRIPQDLIDQEEEEIKKLLLENIDLASIKRVTVNAYKLYYKTRSIPTIHGVKAAKGIPFPPKIHPLIIQRSNKDMIEKNEFLDGLKKFRPQNTIFEVNVDESKKVAHDVMVTKRQVHSNQKEAKRLAKELVTNRQQKNLEEDNSNNEDKEEKKQTSTKFEGSKKEKSFKDPNYFMEMLPSTTHSELGLAINDHGIHSKDIVLDLMADDIENLNKSKMVKKWDRKRKKFVTVHENVDVNNKKQMKDEAGKQINKEERGKIYAQWKKKTHMSLPVVGETEDPNTVKQLGGYTKPTLNSLKFKHKQVPKIPNNGAKNELKNKDQILKERRIKKYKQDLAKGKRKKLDSTTPRPSKRHQGAPSRSKKIYVQNKNKNQKK